ncbi:putative leucine-rich repeat-containing protein DDB_G0290503 [Cydia amplana]|uniref:putative leucine-rich repeat-containing protein DDB_G0290503 n=1 Tax=Cydia amplana TaxID=1869771 RepID=UPI002FE5464B
MEEPKAQSTDNVTSNPENNPNIMVAINRPKESGIIDPIMLKQLLKRSNGSSLSEMLQRHNLSLTDLLQGRNEAISALNSGATNEPQQSDISLESNSKLNEEETKYSTRQTLSKEKIAPTESSSDEDTKGHKNNGNTENDEQVANKDANETENKKSKPRMSTRRRFPTGIRRKLRMRPTLNSTLKAQLSRDLIALSARKYSNNNKNVTKSREWKDIVPMMPDRSKTDNNENSKDEVMETAPTTTDGPVETTTSSLKISSSSYSLSGGKNVSNAKDNEVENVAATTTEATATITIEVMPDEIMSEIEKPKIAPIVRPTANNFTLRRQAFNNKLKRKRLKQKSSTTENPSDDLMRNFLGMANLVSASQFIERTQKPHTTLKMDNTEFTTELEDFLTTETPPETVDGGVKSTSRFTTSTTPRIHAQTSSTSTTEQTAKFEIQEILNDKMTKERLAKILRERNMTLNELVNHRERGSSHVHLADIFHNASKEPNPPEPFLTKSSIEPISKETYPLRAILEANTYETTTRSVSSQADQKNMLIPVVMNFGNNVNENGESMGIISLFNKIAENEVTIDKTDLKKDSNGTPYVSSIISVNATNANDTNRESRAMEESEDWNELLTFMKAHNISTFEDDLQVLDKGNTEKESLENLEKDGLMILEDLQNLENFQSGIASGSGDNVETSIQENKENLSENPGILNKLHNNTKSVAIATASILGLAAILFLLTYIAFKWKQQRNKLRKKESFCDGPIPSPVFENRKGNKTNCSSRSISPMISNTNIYMSTLETNSGKESPDYMWNSLRKPFQ